MNAPGNERSALVLGGGGILGAAYEVAVLAGLEQRFGEGTVYRSFDLFVGTSAGSFVAALIGQGFPPGRLYRAFLDQDPALFLRPGDVYRVDWARLARGLWSFAWGLVRSSAVSLRRGRVPPPMDLFSSGLEQLPAGFLSVDPLAARLHDILIRHGLRDTFEGLEKPILIPALDLDRGERRVFGNAEEEDIPISLAVTASSALPRLFGPVRIGSRFFVDGAIGGAAHLDVPLERGARAILFVNPLVASCSAPPPGHESLACDCRLVSHGGLGTILDQCQKIEHEAAVDQAFEAARLRHPGAELVRIQPPRSQMFPQGVMEYSVHRDVLESGFRGVESLPSNTLEQLHGILRPRPARITGPS